MRYHCLCMRSSVMVMHRDHCLCMRSSVKILHRELVVLLLELQQAAAAGVQEMARVLVSSALPLLQRTAQAVTADMDGTDVLQKFVAGKVSAQYPPPCRCSCLQSGGHVICCSAWHRDAADRNAIRPYNSHSRQATDLRRRSELLSLRVPGQQVAPVVGMQLWNGRSMADALAAAAQPQRWRCAIRGGAPDGCAARADVELALAIAAAAGAQPDTMQTSRILLPALPACLQWANSLKLSSLQPGLAADGGLGDLQRLSLTVQMFRTFRIPDPGTGPFKAAMAAAVGALRLCAKLDAEIQAALERQPQPAVDATARRRSPAGTWLHILIGSLTVLLDRLSDFPLEVDEVPVAVCRSTILLLVALARRQSAFPQLRGDWSVASLAGCSLLSDLLDDCQPQPETAQLGEALLAALDESAAAMQADADRVAEVTAAYDAAVADGRGSPMPAAEAAEAAKATDVAVAAALLALDCGHLRSVEALSKLLCAYFECKREGAAAAAHRAVAAEVLLRVYWSLARCQPGPGGQPLPAGLGAIVWSARQPLARCMASQLGFVMRGGAMPAQDDVAARVVDHPAALRRVAAGGLDLLAALTATLGRQTQELIWRLDHPSALAVSCPARQN